MSAVAKIELQQTALSMVRIGLRLSYIRGVTRLNERFLRGLWKEVHGKSPSSGTSYTSEDTGLKTYSQSRQSAAFANIYMTTAKGYGLGRGFDYVGSKEHYFLDPNTFLDAWSTYTELAANEDLTPDIAWQVVRNLTSSTTVWTHCKKCSTGFIHLAHVKENECKCPFCTDAARSQRRQKKDRPVQGVSLAQQAV